MTSQTHAQWPLWNTSVSWIRNSCNLNIHRKLSWRLGSEKQEACFVRAFLVSWGEPALFTVHSPQKNLCWRRRPLHQGIKEDHAGEILVNIQRMEPKRPMHFQLNGMPSCGPLIVLLHLKAFHREFQLWQRPVRFHAPFPHVIKKSFLPQAKENTGIFNFKMFGWGFIFNILDVLLLLFGSLVDIPSCWLCCWAFLQISMEQRVKSRATRLVLKF